MERVLYNTVLGALPLQPDGRTFYYADCNFEGRKVYSTRRWACCAGTLPQVSADYHISTYFRRGEDVWVNLYLPSRLHWRAGGAEIRLTQSGNYPLSETIDLLVECSRPVEFEISLRIPAWTRGARLDRRAQASGQWARLRRIWKNGDRIRLELPMPLRLEAVDAENPNLLALLCGPLVLMPLRHHPVASPQELLNARRLSADTWSVRDVRLKPYFAIGDEPYSTYWKT